MLHWPWCTLLGRQGTRITGFRGEVALGWGIAQEALEAGTGTMPIALPMKAQNHCDRATAVGCTMQQVMHKSAGCFLPRVG